MEEQKIKCIYWHVSDQAFSLKEINVIFCAIHDWKIKLKYISFLAISLLFSLSLLLEHV